MRLATKTKQLIEQAIESDQGTAYRANLQKILPKIEDAYRPSEDGFRTHLGASLIGRDCSFELFLGFRWVQKSRFPERILRLFNRGHLEEAHFIAMIQAADLDIWYETADGGQFRFSDHGGHFGSALDGVIRVPELEGEPAYAEFKTHNDKSFKKLVKEGVQNSKYEHYVQMQICMNKMKLKHAVYFSVNKNDDDIFIEIIDYNDEVAQRYLSRAGTIIFTSEGVPRISDRAGWWQCKFCNLSDICHGKKKPEINCRTCAHSTALKDGTWQCERIDLENKSSKDQKLVLTKALQEAGCALHIYNPHLLPSVELIGGQSAQDDYYLELKLASGNVVKNGNNHIQSQDLDLEA